MFYKKFEIETKKNIEKLNKNKNRYFLHIYHTLNNITQRYKIKIKIEGNQNLEQIYKKYSWIRNLNKNLLELYLFVKKC